MRKLASGKKNLPVAPIGDCICAFEDHETVNLKVPFIRVPAHILSNIEDLLSPYLVVHKFYLQ